MRIKNRIVLTIFMAIMLVCLVACNVSATCFHVDVNKDGKCDKCGVDLTTVCVSHIDNDKNGRCDVCGAEIREQCASHMDENQDGKCDKCGESVSIQCDTHVDMNGNGKCDRCGVVIAVIDENGTSVDFYSVNDLHGKFCDSDTQPGVDNLTTYFKEKQQKSDNVVLLSAGDTWQGSVESNSTRGSVLTEWMNESGFAAMTLGNHEFDWGRDVIQAQLELAQFPFLAINIYERESNVLADYCQPSVTLDVDGVSVGIIGAIGDCYSSISSDKVQDVYFKTGDQLSSLVKTESAKLRSQGVDFVIYLVHDSYDAYDVSLSDGYVDLVFEGHSHSTYIEYDSYGVCHMQAGGENKGVSHAKVVFDENDDAISISVDTVKSSTYAAYDADPIVDTLVEKYRDQIGDPYRIVGYNAALRSSSELCDKVAELYYNVGVETWGDQYPIVLGGGFLSARSPYNLEAGNVTYAMLNSLFPFDNTIQLCSVKGESLYNNFLYTKNSRYHIYYGNYGAQVKNDIDMNATYYIVVDSYTTQYKPNGLTMIAEYSTDVMARDLLEKYLKEGNWA